MFSEAKESWQSWFLEGANDRTKERESLIVCHSADPILVKIRRNRLQFGDDEMCFAFIRDRWTEIAEETPRVEREGKLNQSSKMEAMGTLAGGIAHGYNDILKAIFGLIDIAKDEPCGPKLRDCLDEIELAVDHASRLVGQILTFSRAQPEEMGPVCFADVVGEAPKLPACGGSIEIRVDLEH